MGTSGARDGDSNRVKVTESVSQRSGIKGARAVKEGGAQPN